MNETRNKLKLLYEAWTADAITDDQYRTQMLVIAQPYKQADTLVKMEFLVDVLMSARGDFLVYELMLRSKE